MIKKIIPGIALIIIAACLIIPVGSAAAVDIAGANVTYIFTDNFTITFGSPLDFAITANTTALEESFTDATEAGAQVIADEIGDKIDDIISFAIVAVLLVLAWRDGGMLPLGFAGITLVLYGISFWAANHYIAVILAAWGVLCFFVPKYRKTKKDGG